MPCNTPPLSLISLSAVTPYKWHVMLNTNHALSALQPISQVFYACKHGNRPGYAVRNKLAQDFDQNYIRSGSDKVTNTRSIKSIKMSASATLSVLKFVDVKFQSQESPENTRLGFDESYEKLASALCTVSLAGDSPTTDRIFAALETQTMILVLDSELEKIINVLPIMRDIFWNHLFVTISTKEYTKSPVKSILDRCAALSDREIEEKRRNMVAAYAQLSYTQNQTRVFDNFMSEAYFVANPSQKYVVHRDAVHHN
jgi:hypothetical protein